MLESASPPDLVCKVLVRERASEKGGIEGVESAMGGKVCSYLGSGTKEEMR
jgi:hypothetical protein